ncbi:restriction endonuclease [Novacetimonas pomaceti]|uniref:Restriction endonuclease n=1 Tax=Novacetimonas pomaceti TaxID=2021998 RepID=A0ABX5P3E4_9PROT|nr:restriction endonuclease [Novacetimonas pomaceti]
MAALQIWISSAYLRCFHTNRQKSSICWPSSPRDGWGKTEKNMRVWAYACLLLCLPVHAQAGSIYKVKHPTVACGDDAAIKSLNDRTNPHQNDPQWRRTTMSQGQCYAVTPDMRWEKIANRNGLPLLRHSPPVPGMPPLYFMTADIADLSPPPASRTADAPAAPPRAAPDATTGADAATGATAPAGPAAPVPDTQEQQGPVIIARTDPPAPTDLFFMTGGFQKVGSMLLSALLIMGAGWILVVLYRAIMAFVGRRAALRQARAVVERNAGLLIQRRLHAHEGQAAHGQSPDRQWQREVSRFCRTTVIPALAHEQREHYWTDIEKKVHASIDAVSSRPAPPRPDLRLITTAEPYRPGMSCAQYVAYCMELLEKAGWDARLPGNVERAGTLISASKDSLSMVVQCWTERRPVEEAIIHQCVAAKADLSARIAVVVSAAPYTQQAIQAGKSSRVFVLHHEELQKFASQVEAPQVA